MITTDQVKAALDQLREALGLPEGTVIHLCMILPDLAAFETLAGERLTRQHGSNQPDMDILSASLEDNARTWAWLQVDVPATPAKAEVPA